MIGLMSEITDCVLFTKINVELKPKKVHRLIFEYIMVGIKLKLKIQCNMIKSTLSFCF